MKYKIWATIEEIDEDTDHYKDVYDEVPIGEFETFEEAQKAIQSLEVV